MKECYVFNDFIMVNKLILYGYDLRYIRPNFSESGLVYVFGPEAAPVLHKLIEEKKQRRAEINDEKKKEEQLQWMREQGLGDWDRWHFTEEEVN